MSEIMTRSDDTAEITEAQIIAWLKDNPGFLQRNPDVLDLLTPPAEKKGKGVADFQYYMVKRLREDRQEVLQSAKEIIETSRANMNNLSRIHTAVLLLLEAHSFEDFLRTITLDFASVLDVDIVSLVVEADGEGVPQIDLTGVRVAPPGAIDGLLKERKVVLESDIKAYEAIFGGGASLVKSQALVRLTVLPKTPPILLAFGSRDPNSFQTGQATDLISFLGKVVERNMRGWLGLY